MPFIDAKVYYDGSHYICIPYREPIRKRKKSKVDELENDEPMQEENEQPS